MCINNVQMAVLSACFKHIIGDDFPRMHCFIALIDILGCTSQTLACPVATPRTTLFTDSHPSTLARLSYQHA
jgi:hypothetical protein